jgi:hypothetical protein
MWPQTSPLTVLFLRVPLNNTVTCWYIGYAEERYLVAIECMWVNDTYNADRHSRATSACEIEMAIEKQKVTNKSPGTDQIPT